jgi:hypothetical protein
LSALHWQPGRSRVQRAIVPVVVALHIAVAWLWLRMAPVPVPEQGGARTVFMQLITQRAPPPKVATARPTPKPSPSRQSRRAPARSQAPIASLVAAASPASPASVAPVAPSDPFAPDADAITTQAKKDVVVWDRATNKDRLKGITNFDDRPLAVAIRGAFKPRHTTMTNYMTSDGRAITKVQSPSGTYCLVRLNENSIMSETLRRQGSDTRKVACP